MCHAGCPDAPRPPSPACSPSPLVLCLPGAPGPHPLLLGPSHVRDRKLALVSAPGPPHSCWAEGQSPRPSPRPHALRLCPHRPLGCGEARDCCPLPRVHMAWPCQRWLLPGPHRAPEGSWFGPSSWGATSLLPVCARGLRGPGARACPLPVGFLSLRSHAMCRPGSESSRGRCTSLTPAALCGVWSAGSRRGGSAGAAACAPCPRVPGPGPRPCTGSTSWPYAWPVFSLLGMKTSGASAFR